MEVICKLILLNILPSRFSGLSTPAVFWYPTLYLPTKLADQEQSLGLFYAPCPFPIFVALQTALPRIAPRLNSATFHHPLDQMPDETWLKEGSVYFVSRCEGTQSLSYFSRLVAPLSCEMAPLELRVSLPHG